MEFFYLGLALLTAGACFLSGMTNLVGGSYRDGDKTEFIFGILSISAFIFLLLPPVGFIIKDTPPYTLAIEFKRIFIWLYYGLLPWFIEYYTGYKKRWAVYAVDGILVVAYIAMLYAKIDKTVWFYISRVALGLILYYGVVAAAMQLKTQRKREGQWLMSAMIIYGVLYILSTLNQAGRNFLGEILGITGFFPLHLNLVAFLVIMAVRIRASSHEKYRLEKILRWRDRRWDLLMQSMELIVIELDTEGKVRYINPYALKKFGYTQENEILGKDWFTVVSHSRESKLLRSLYLDAIGGKKPLLDGDAGVRTRNGDQFVINWTNVFVHNTNDSLSGVMKIGMDVTEQVKAFDQVHLLKMELEKENLLLKGEKLKEQTENDIVGQSEVLLEAIDKAKQVAATNAGVLLLGETGSGKELFANLVHRSSYRSKRPFVKINCAAMPSELIESELFGHEKGSFTGAVMSRKGKFELADGGTVFLDEIGELPLSLQAKLLRVLQSGEFERIGGQQVIKVDVRVIAATNRNLQQEVKSGKFRNDLFYRLNVFPITVPSLRERGDDIPFLVSHYVRKFSMEQNKSISEVSRADMLRLTEYSWPGNIRELINLMERSVIGSKGPVLHLDWQRETNNTVVGENGLLLMEEVERAHIIKVLQDCNWKINGEDGAAYRLGLNPSTLRSRLKKLQIERG